MADPVQTKWEGGCDRLSQEVEHSCQPRCFPGRVESREGPFQRTLSEEAIVGGWDSKRRMGRERVDCLSMKALLVTVL